MVVFAEARGCATCVAAVRAARDAVGVAGVDAQLIVLIVDSATSREEVARFARSVGRSSARYVVDDGNDGLASMLGASDLGGATVYDVQGKVVAHPHARVHELAAALRDAPTR